MKAISLIQPWASLIIDGKKTIETRSWGTKYRGPIAIHASMKKDRAACQQFGYNSKLIPVGKVLGIANIVECVQFPDPRAPPDAYGNFTAGRFGWLLTHVIRFPVPVPAKGHLSLWEWNETNKTGE